MVDVQMCGLKIMTQHETIQKSVKKLSAIRTFANFHIFTFSHLQFCNWQYEIVKLHKRI